MNCLVSWQWAITTSWGSTCSHVATSATGTTPSTVRSEYCQRQTTMNWGRLGTRVTPAKMHSASTMAWCSPRMTATMTLAQKTVQHAGAADSGTTIAISVEWTLLAVLVTLTGVVFLEVISCSPVVCGCSVSRQNIEHSVHAALHCSHSNHLLHSSSSTVLTAMEPLIFTLSPTYFTIFNESPKNVTGHFIGDPYTRTNLVQIILPTDWHLGDAKVFNITFFMIFAVFDPSPLTLWINLFLIFTNIKR